MGIKTTIQWCDSTVNPTKGCEGCELWNKIERKCYAGKMTRRFGGANPGFAERFEEVGTNPGRMATAALWKPLYGRKRPDKPWLNGKPRHVFVSDMSDALSAAVSFEYLSEEIIAAVTSEAGQNHQWLWLTKRPKRMAEFSNWLADLGQPWPINLWAGTSVTTQGTCSRITDLMGVGDDSTIRFVSVEPQWEEIDLTPWLPSLDWVIQGGESGSVENPFDLAWARTLSAQCQEQGVAYFLKQLGTCVVDGGERVRLVDRHGGDWNEWPRRLRLRQMPSVARKQSTARRSKNVLVT